MGEVKLCKHKQTKIEYAVKIIKKAKSGHRDSDMQRREIEALKICQHPNLIGFYDFFENNTHYHIVIEYLQGGDLFDYLERRDFKITEERARDLAA
jgi:serine/threonine protein kinase